MKKSTHEIYIFPTALEQVFKFFMKTINFEVVLEVINFENYQF